MKKSLLYLLAFIIIISLFIFNQNKEPEVTNQTQKVKIGLYKGEASSLMIFAQKLGYLKDENLDVEIKLYPSGRDAMKGMLNGEVDYANCTDFVASKNSFKRKDFTILASMAEASINGVLAKKNSGIINPEDIKGKRVGTTIGTATEYYTGVFLEQYDLGLNDVKLVNVPRKKRYEVMQKDEVDALFAWEPFIYNLKKEYNDEITYYSMPVGFEFYFIFVANNSFHKTYPEVSTKLIRAMYKAEKYKDQNYDRFKQEIKEYFNLDDEYLKYSLEKHDFRLTFPYTLSTVMANQAYWLEKNNLAKGEKIQDFNTLFDIKDLKEISPLSVTVME